jgi:peptidyl-prolyl cis-trans isomerase D
MAMLISKFHRLIQSRVLWGSFLVIVVFTFVIWGTQMPSQSRRSAEENAVGKFDGRFVSPDEFRHHYFNSYMSAVLMLGRPFDVDAEMDARLRDGAWRRMAALQQAAALQLTGTDEEVRAAIQSHPGFAVNGQFNQQAYASFVQNMLNRMGFSGIQFEEHVREEIAMQKVQRMLQQSVLVAPYDITRTFRSLTDVFDIEYAVLTRDDVAGEAKVTREDARMFFEANPEAFRVSEQAVVHYVEWPVTNFLAGIEVSEDDALAYYDENIDAFQAPDTSTVARTGSTGEVEEVAASNRMITLTFDQVRTDIVERLTWETARTKAADAATDFVVSLAPDREGDAPAFEDAAAKAGLAARAAGPFCVTDEVAGVDAGILFARAAFSLSPNPDEYFSDAVPGRSNVYVIGLQKKLDSRIPDFEEVEDAVRAAARAKALEEKLAARAQEIRDAAEKGVAEGAAFAASLEPFGLKPERLEAFTLAGNTLTNEYADALIRGILSRNPGEVTELLPFQGEVLVAYVAERKAGDPTALDVMRPQIVESIVRQRSRILMDDWQEYLLKKGNFEDLRKPGPEPQEEEYEEDASSSSEEPAAD